MAASLRHVLLLQRDVDVAARFFRDGLGLAVRAWGQEWAELEAGSTRIAFKRVDSEAHRTCGYTPFLSFDVEDMDVMVPKLLQLGGTLDGPIKYHAHGKVAALRAPDGPMISLFEANVPHASKDVP